MNIEIEAPPEHTPVAGALASFDVFALIVNKMLGTGIFTSPSLVLALTGSREKAIAFWVVGFIYSIIRYTFRLTILTNADCLRSMFLYLGFAAVLPYNTGELVYVRT